jgi:hypothetical protein
MLRNFGQQMGKLRLFSPPPSPAFTLAVTKPSALKAVSLFFSRSWLGVQSVGVH